MKRISLQTATIMLFSFCFFIILAAFSTRQDKKPWPVPDNYKNMKNPLAGDASAINDGKALYATHCKSCHGAKGLGDGNKAAQLKTDPGDFSAASFQSQTDGVLLYKTSEGRDDMPGFTKKIPDVQDRWAIVNYLRTLKK